MTLKFQKFSEKYMSVWTEKMVRTYCVEKKLKNIPEHLLTLNFDKN